MKFSGSVLLIMLVFGSSIVWAVEPPCRDQLLNICQTNAEGNPICQILQQDALETPVSIALFLNAIRPLDESQQELMVCARLKGRKRLKLGGFHKGMDKEVFGSKFYSVDSSDNPSAVLDQLLLTSNCKAHKKEGHSLFLRIQFHFSKTTNIVDQWLMLRKMRPGDRDLSIVFTLDITEVKLTVDTYKPRRSSECEFRMWADITIDSIVSVDPDSTRRIQQAMIQTLTPVSEE